MSLTRGPDFSSSEDEFDDPDFKDLMKQQRLQRIHNMNSNLTEKQIKEQKLKKVQMHIITKNNEEVIKEINDGLDVNEKLEDDCTLITLAASIGNYELVVQLFEMGADVNIRKGSDTILMCACNCPASRAPFEVTAKVVEFLLDKGVDVKATNRRRMNALMFAASNGNLSAVELLLPHAEINDGDNQEWNVLFWAVYSGNPDLVEYLIDKGLSPEKTDIRGNTPLDIAIDYNHKDIIKLLTPEEEESENFSIVSSINFEDNFKGLQIGERPIFFQDVFNFLHGTRCENLVKLFVTNNVSLLDFLSFTEEEIRDLGVEMPFQIRRLLAGIHRFHKTPFHPNSVPKVKKDELYSNIDIAAAVLTAVKQLICMEAAFKYIIKNTHNLESLHNIKTIENTLFNIEIKVRRLRKVLARLNKRAVEWDSQVEPVNIITSKNGKRWFPWRKAIAVFGIVVVISFKFWRQPTSLSS